MPRTPKTPRSASDVKPAPYDRSSPSASPSPQSSDPVSQDDISPTKRKKSRKGEQKKAWSNNELVQMFETVAKQSGGLKIWDGAIEGRTMDQCYQTWSKTIVPFIKKSLENKATK